MKISRRECIKLAAKGGLFLGGIKSGLISPAEAFAMQSSNGITSEVFISTSKDHALAVRNAVQMIGGIEKFVKRGDKVILKPNMAWARTPEYAANTNPVVVAEIVKMCLEAGAKKVSVTDNPCNSARTVYSMSKIAEMAARNGADVFYPKDRFYREQKVNGKFLDRWEIYMPFAEADKIINIPVAKQHSSSRVSLSMKNWMGAIGGNRGWLHQDLETAIADLAGYFEPALILIDCTRMLMRGGPTGGSLSYVETRNKIIAATDQVAADTIATEMLGANPSSIGHIIDAHNRKIGTMHKGSIRITEKSV